MTTIGSIILYFTPAPPDFQNKLIQTIGGSDINSLIIMMTSFYKIPPHLPFPKGGKLPLFDKEGPGEILQCMSIQF
jgi:hypothetical protein